MPQRDRDRGSGREGEGEGEPAQPSYTSLCMKLFSSVGFWIQLP